MVNNVSTFLSYLAIAMPLCSVILKETFFSGHLPEKPPSRLTKPKPRLIVSQRYTQAREDQVRPDGVSDEKCDLCKVILTPALLEEHKETEMHVLRLSYRRNKYEF